MNASILFNAFLISVVGILLGLSFEAGLNRFFRFVAWVSLHVRLYLNRNRDTEHDELCDVVRTADGKMSLSPLEGAGHYPRVCDSCWDKLRSGF